MKRLFVIGCSYTSWREGKCYGSSYPALIAQQYPDWQVYDASEPGSSNDSAFFRLQHLERTYGKPDKIIIQWTHLGRTNLVLSYKHIPRSYNWKTSDNYLSLEKYDPDDNISTSTTITSTSFVNKSTGRRIHEKHLSDISLMSKRQLSKYYSWFLHTETLYWNTYKEILLINGVYGEDRVLTFDWHNWYHPGAKFNMPSNWIGNVQDALGDKFKSLSIDDAQHYGSAGHRAVYNWLDINLNEFLAQ